MCRRCEKELPLDRFPVDRRNKDGRRGQCKTCTNTRAKERGGSRPMPSEKFCSNCESVKPASEFTKNSWSVDGLHRLCQACSYVQGKRQQLQDYYGLTLEEYGQMKVAQNGACALCRRPPKNRALSVDHCHTTGRVRGLLCWPCNRFLGHIRDCPDTLSRMISYLEGVSTCLEAGVEPPADEVVELPLRKAS